jgi:thioredoxin-dependent peroxiredoxin
MLAEASQAPDFTLPNQDGNPIPLSAYLGSWVILYFYPKDDTPGCTAEACAFRDNFPFYEDLGIAAIGISQDSIASHKAFQEKYSLPFELLSDTNGVVSQAYGSGVEGTPKRISYLINPEGIIAKAYPTVKAATHAQTVLADLKVLMK